MCNPQMHELFLPGTPISADKSLVKGHGTHIYNNTIFSSTLGLLSKVNKVIYIKPLCPLIYTGLIGDVIIGRVTNIYNKRWILNGNTTNEMYLSSSAIMFPGVEPRLRLEEDELRMRDFLGINDLICGQVQKTHKNGGMAIHTRNEKFKKLTNGVCVEVPVMIIQKFKTQFMQNDGIEVIVGVNGFVWVGGCNIEKIKKVYVYVNQCVIDLVPIREDILSQLL